MKLEKRAYDYKKHIIHVLVAGAMALSWGTVAHVQTYLKDHLRNAPTRSKLRKSQPLPEEANKATPSEATPKLAQATVAATAPKITPKIVPMATTKKVALPAVKPVITTESLISAVAAKVGLSITQTKIDTSFIRKVEGSRLQGYVPLAGSSNSGVTVADGFDLGQIRAIDLNKLPLSAALKEKLRPYVGLTKFKAKDFLKSHPLTISEDQLDQLNVIAANKILIPLVENYNRDSGKSFLDLPHQAQTAIFSYAYQNGPWFMKRGSNKQLWRNFINQNWKGASSTLRSYRMYATRRVQEAQLLDKIA